MTTVSPALLAKLVRSVALLALPYAGQAEWLGSLGLGVADELALEFDDCVLLLPQFEEAGWLSPDVRQAILKLDARLVEQSGPSHEDFWRLGSLRDAREWEHVRAAALEVLMKL